MKIPFDLCVLVVYILPSFLFIITVYTHTPPSTQSGHLLLLLSRSCCAFAFVKFKAPAILFYRLPLICLYTFLLLLRTTTITLRETFTISIYYPSNGRQPYTTHTKNVLLHNQPYNFRLLYAFLLSVFPHIEFIYLASKREEDFNRSAPEMIFSPLSTQTGRGLHIHFTLFLF